MRVLENKVVNLEVFPGKSGEEIQGDAQAQAQGAAAQVQNSAKGAASTAQEQTKGAQEQAQTHAKGLQEQAGQYQEQSGDYIKSTSDAAHQQSQQYVSDAKDAAHSAVKDNLPENTHSYAGQAVDYTSNLATGTVGTLGGAGKDLGDTVANAVCII